MRATDLPVAQTTQVLERTDDGKSLEQENEEMIEKFSAQIDEINAMEGDFDKLDNDGLRAKTEELRRRIQAGGVGDAELNEGFALLREAVWRVLELWYFDVQLLGGMVLHSGRLAEMKTGEGKTIVSLLPTFLAALEGKGGCFVVTTNDYLARRDAENVGQVLRFLGVSVGLVQAPMEPAERQKAYEADVVWLSNAELGFDYLRDNLAVYPSQIVQSKPFHFALVDEADSILIDEARTPLIISESVPAVPRQFLAAREVAVALDKDMHYTVDEKNMNVLMTDLGERVAAELLGTDNMWSPEEAWILYTLNALKAKELFTINEQYIVRDGKVAIVDTFTGRVLEGRRWADGMHQAIECKEQIDPSFRSQVSAQITYQSLFRLFPKLCAMTGTALTEAAEFDEIYALRGTAVPTARPNVRRDYPDVVYRTEEAKLEAIVDEIVLNNERNGRPILVGTSNVKWSELLVQRLRERGVEPNLLNARPESVARESETIAQAGRQGKVTVSTNMAGRGTDIILGGNHSSMAVLNMRARLANRLLPLEEQGKVPPVDEDFYPCTIPAKIEDQLDEAVNALADSEAAGEYGTFLAVEELVATLAGEAPFDPGPTFELLVELREAFSSLKNLFKDALAAEKQRVVEAGGLYVLGTTRHESRRIDNQLRGRAGRQGDPGTTRFFISLQDDVFRIFGGEKIEGLMDRFKLGDKIPLQSPIVNDTLNRVQQAVEEFFKRTRTTLFEFDKVISKQRELTYQVRRNFLAADDAKVRQLIEQWGSDSVQIHMGKAAEMSHEEKSTEFKEYYGFDMPSIGEYSKPEEEDEEFPGSIVETLDACVQEGISRKWDEYEQFRPGFPIEAARIATIVTIDDEWKDLLQKMDALKQTVGLAAYKGRNPLKEYQVQGFRMYEKCADNFKARSVSRWLRSKPKKQ
jgi:preprotein translocase subunit SecA